MDRNYFSILFFIKKSKLLKNGEAPICLRITINGQRAEVQIKRSVEVSIGIAKKNAPLERNGNIRSLTTILKQYVQRYSVSTENWSKTANPSPPKS